MNPKTQFERDLEQWLQAEAPARAPAGLHATVIDRARTMRQRPGWATSLPVRWSGRGWGRGTMLFAAAALLLVGGALAAGTGLVRLPSLVPPKPAPPVAVVASPSPAAESPSPSLSPSPSPYGPGALIAYVRTTEKPNNGGNCGPDSSPTCGIPRLWLVGTDGSNAHELFPDGLTPQTHLSWSPDGARLLYMDNARWYLTDAIGSEPQLVDTGCAAPCQRDWQAAFSSDGTKLVFMRNSLDAAGYTDPGGIATLDLASGRVTVLSSTADAGGALPGWSPDGKQIVFWRGGSKETGGPIAPVLDAVFVVEADGQNLHQVTPKTLAAANPRWSPDGSRIVFTSPQGQNQDIYTMRPDGTDRRRLTTDGISGWASWTPDGRILFVRGSGGAGRGGTPDFWTMDADGANAAQLIPGMMAGVEDPAWTQAPAWQPAGGPATVPPPWNSQPATPVGPPPATPSPTPTPALASGFAWTGSMNTAAGDPNGDTAVPLADGRVLILHSCQAAADVYDPATGTFSPTGPMAAIRGAEKAIPLRDGRVLVTGGGNCGDASTEAVLASAELYAPATGTFGPTGSMRTPRFNHTATLLQDGRILITGGSTMTAGGDFPALASAELYDPATGTFGRTGSMSKVRDQPTATVLRDGRVLVVGGGGGEANAAIASAELYDPATGTFSRTGSMRYGRPGHTATLLGNGRVLVAGGTTPTNGVYATAELYDPPTGRFSSTGSMHAGRQQHTATLLRDGRVLITGGYQSQSGGLHWRDLSSTELYDPETGMFTSSGSMGQPRMVHTATLMPDGRVLIAGGLDINSGGANLTSAVLYQP